MTQSERHIYSDYEVVLKKPKNFLGVKVGDFEYGFSCPRCNNVYPQLSHGETFVCDCRLASTRWGNILEICDEKGYNYSNLRVYEKTPSQYLDKTFQLEVGFSCPSCSELLPVLGHGEKMKCDCGLKLRRLGNWLETK